MAIDRSGDGNFTRLKPPPVALPTNVGRGRDNAIATRKVTVPTNLGRGRDNAIATRKAPVAKAANTPIKRAAQTRISTPATISSRASAVPAGPPPEAFAAPVPAPITDFNQFDDNRLMAEDSGFKEQTGILEQALAKYLADLKLQRGSTERDGALATQGIEKNRGIGLTSQAEDFAARGMGQSGLFVKAQGDASDRYDTQKKNVETSVADAVAQLGSKEAQYRVQNEASRKAARNAAVNNLTMKQRLIGG